MLFPKNWLRYEHLWQVDALTLPQRQLQLAVDQQATAQAQVNSAQAQVDMAVEDLRTAKATGDEQKVKEAEVKVKEAKQEVKDAEGKVETAEAKVKEAKEEMKAQQEKAIRCRVTVLPKDAKIDESYFTYLHILSFKQFFSEYPQYASKRWMNPTR